ncbi:MAG: hypothetical protein ACM3QS_05435 [Bacteroidota bacterium]
MSSPGTRIAVLLPLVAALVGACNLPPATPRPADIQATSVALTVSALGTQIVLPPTSAETPTQAFAPSETNTAVPVGTPQKPLVVQDVLCWEGPGPVYEVVSAVKKGERVTLLGRGSTGAWWVIDNPIYHDPCWVVSDALQFDPGFNLSGLKVFNPPPTPTPTYTPVPTATSTRQP